MFMVGFFVAVGLRFLYRESGADAPGGRLEYGAGVKALGWIAVGISLIVLVLMFVMDHGEYLAMIGIVALFGFLGLFLLTETLLTTGYFDSNEISISNVWGTKRGSWTDLKKVEFKNNGQYFVLEFNDGSRVKFSRMLSGHSAVCDHVKQLGFEITGLPDS